MLTCKPYASHSIVGTSSPNQYQENTPCVCVLGGGQGSLHACIRLYACMVNDKILVYMKLPCDIRLGCEGSNTLATLVWHWAGRKREKDPQLVPLWRLLASLLCHCLGGSDIP